MAPPMLWLCSEDGGSTTGQRFVAGGSGIARRPPSVAAKSLQSGSMAKPYFQYCVGPSDRKWRLKEFAERHIGEPRALLIPISYSGRGLADPDQSVGFGMNLARVARCSRSLVEATGVGRPPGRGRPMEPTAIFFLPSPFCARNEASGQQSTCAFSFHG